MRVNIRKLIGECREMFRRLPESSEARRELGIILQWWDDAPETVEPVEVLAVLHDAREEMRRAA